MSDTAYFQVAPRLAILLGETYRSSEQAVKELVDNAWDADAEEVWIELPSLDAHLHRYSNPAHVRIQGRVTPSGLLSDVTADWGAVIENSKGYVELEEFVRLLLKTELRKTFKREFALQHGRIKQEIDRRLSRRVECPGYDHFQMVGNNAMAPCKTGYPILRSLVDTLGVPAR